MKSRIWIFLAALALFVGVDASAQDCSVSFSPNFSLWENESADSTYISTQVGLDGSGTMTLQGGSCDLPEIEHTAYLWNSVGSASSGWQSFGEYCPDCYVSVEQDEGVAYDPSQTYTFDYEGEMDCNIGGTFFDLSGTGTVGFSVGNFVNSGPGGIYTNGCLFKLSCPNGTTSTCAPPSVSDQGNDCNFTYDHEYYLTWTPSGGTPKCYALNLGAVSNSPVDCR